MVVSSTNAQRDRASNAITFSGKTSHHVQQVKCLSNHRLMGLPACVALRLCSVQLAKKGPTWAGTSLLVQSPRVSNVATSSGRVRLRQQLVLLAVVASQVYHAQSLKKARTRGVRMRLVFPESATSSSG